VRTSNPERLDGNNKHQMYTRADRKTREEKERKSSKRGQNTVNL